MRVPNIASKFSHQKPPYRLNESRKPGFEGTFDPISVVLLARLFPKTIGFTYGWICGPAPTIWISLKSVQNCNLYCVFLIYINFILPFSDKLSCYFSRMCVCISNMLVTFNHCNWKLQVRGCPYTFHIKTSGFVHLRSLIRFFFSLRAILEKCYPGYGWAMMTLKIT